MLSDSCADAAIALANAVIDYAEFDYSLDQMERVVSGLFVIGSVASELDSQGWPIPPTNDEDRAWAARHYVLRTLLDDECIRGDIRAALPTLAAVASSVPQLRQAIEELHEWLQTEAATQQALEGQFSAQHLRSLYRMAIEGPAASPYSA